MSKLTGQTIYTCDRCGTTATDVTNWRSFNFHFGQNVHEMIHVNGELREYCSECLVVVTEFLKRHVDALRD